MTGWKIFFKCLACLSHTSGQEGLCGKACLQTLEKLQDGLSPPFLLGQGFKVSSLSSGALLPAHIFRPPRAEAQTSPHGRSFLDVWEYVTAFQNSPWSSNSPEIPFKFPARLLLPQAAAEGTDCYGLGKALDRALLSTGLSAEPTQITRKY